MEDREIIKALECCLSNNYEDCKDCPTKDLSTDYLECRNKLREKALDLINRLQAKAIKEQNKNSKLRNERNRLQAQNKDLAETVHNLTIEKDALFDKAEELKVKVERLNKEVQITKDAYTMLQTKIEIIKSEAVKEFAERLKIEYAKGMSWFKKKESYYVNVSDIDNLLKELLGEDNG